MVCMLKCVLIIYIYITHYHLPLPKQRRPSSETVSWSPNGLKMDRQKGQPNERQKLHISVYHLYQSFTKNQNQV
jgi:hypothetical protein